MANDRESFVLHKKWASAVKELSDVDAGILFRSIMLFVNNEPVSIESEYLNSIYQNIVGQIQSEWAKYNPKTERYHWNYKGGITPENKLIRNSGKMGYWRRSVFERDEFTCQHCKQIGGELNAHHLKPFAEYPKLRFEVSNGLTLCKECHINEHKTQRHERQHNIL